VSDEHLSYDLRVDGTTHRVSDAWYFDSLLTVLREHLGVTGPKLACAHGRCGACTVLVDGVPQCSCLLLAATTTDSEVTTVAGLTSPDGELSDLQAAFVEHNAVQCGYCTPGFIVAATHFLDEHPDATEDDIRHHLYGNLCRCTGYAKIIDAIADVATRRRTADG
jgi:carbon-monoxide dehydrogenase small subunit